MRAVLPAWAALLVMLTAAVLYLPVAAQVAVPLVILVGMAFLARPSTSLLALLAARVLIDLLWWVEGEVVGLNLMELFSAVVALLAVFLSLVELDRVQRHPYFLPFLPFLAVLALAGVRSGETRVAAELGARFVSPVALMFLVSVMFDHRLVHRMVLTLPLVALVPVTLGFFHLANGQMNEMTLEGYARLRGAYSNIHNHAHAMALFAALGLFWTRVATSGWARIAACSFSVACGLLLFLTYVRTALLGLAVFVVVFLALEGKLRVAAMALAAGAFAVMGSAVLQDRFSDVAVVIAGDPEEDTSEVGSGRIGMWSMSMENWSRRSSLELALGVGLDQQRQLNRHELDSHNDYLSLLFQLGPIGLLSYLAFQAVVVWRGLQLRRASPDPWTHAFASFTIALTMTAFVSNALSNSYLSRVHIAWPYFGLAGALFVLSRPLGDEPSAEEPRAVPPMR